MNITLFHGSPYFFDNFTIQGLKNDNSVMAVTAGYYFTTSLNEAIAYSKNELNVIQEQKNGYVYKIDLENLDLEYKAGKDPQRFHKNGILLDLDNIKEKHFTVKVSDIERIIKKLPKEDLIDKINNYFDFYDDKFKYSSERDKINFFVKKIANIYSSLFKDDFLHGFNILGNDFFNNSNEEIDLYNKTFSKIFNIMAFTIEREFDGKQEKHYIFLDKDRIPKITRYNAHEVEVKMVQEKEKIKQEKAKQEKENEKQQNLANFRKAKKERMVVLLKSLRNKIRRNKKNGKKHDHQSIKSEYEQQLSFGKQILFGFKEKYNVYDFVYELNSSLKEKDGVYNESINERIEKHIFDIYSTMKGQFFDTNLELDENEPKHEWHDYVKSNINDVIKIVLMEDIGYKIDQKLEEEYRFDFKI